MGGEPGSSHRRVADVSGEVLLIELDCLYDYSRILGFVAFFTAVGALYFEQAEAEINKAGHYF